MGEVVPQTYGRHTDVAWAIFTHVPEPATLLLFGLGAAGALCVGRRRSLRGA